MHKSHGALQGDQGKGEQVPASINLNGSGASDRSRRTPSDTRAPNGSVNLLKNSRNWECKALYGRRRSSADYRHFISRDLVGDTKVRYQEYSRPFRHLQPAIDHGSRLWGRPSGARSRNDRISSELDARRSIS